MNWKMGQTLGSIAFATALSACGPANNGTNNGTNNGGTNNVVSADCSAATELDVAAYADGGTLEAGSCYLVNSKFSISGGTLIVEEGVELRFNAGVRMAVTGDGRLTVQGTAQRPVVLTGQEQTAGYWKGLDIDSSGADNTMDYLVIEHAGESAWTGASETVASLFARDSSSASITNCVIRDGSGHGFQMRGNSAVTLAGCVISGNDYGGFVHPNNAGLIAGDNEFTENTNNVVRVTFGNTDRLTDAQTWNDIGVPWRIEHRTGLDALLTIAPGAVLEFGEDVSIIVEGEGRLNAVGTEEAPITFTGVEPQRGYWKGIQITTRGADNVLDHAVLEFGGSAAWTGGADTESMLRMDAGSTMSITNSTFRESGNYGIWANDDVVFDAFSGNTFDSNARVAVMHPDVVGQVSADNTFTGNDDNAFRIAFGNTDALVADQTWAALEIPYLVTSRTSITGALTIEAGTTVRFVEDASLVVRDEGSLTAIGTADSPIAFTSPEGEETAGFWKGISIETSAAANEFEYVTVQYAGSSEWYGGGDANGALNLENGMLSLTNVTIADINGWGIDLRGDSMLSACENVTFTNVTENIKGGGICM